MNPNQTGPAAPRLTKRDGICRPPEWPLWKRALLLALPTFLFIVVAAGVGELVLRLTRASGFVPLMDNEGRSLYCPASDPLLPFALRPNATGTWKSMEFTVTVRTNSLGYRDDEFAIPPKPEHIVIACLGDSIAMGHGVDQDETFCSRAEEALRKTRPGVRIHNMAVSGYAQLMQLRQMDLVRETGARIVLVAVCTFNDVLDNDGIVIRKIKEDNFRADGAYSRPIEDHGARTSSWLERHSMLYRYIIIRSCIRPPETGMGGVAWYMFDQLRKTPSQRTLDAYARTAELLDAMLRECQQSGIRMVVVACPLQHEISLELFRRAIARYGITEDEVDRQAVTRFYEAWCRDHEVAFLDMARPLVGCGVSPGKLFYRVDRHPNAKGHAIMAKALSDFLQETIEGLEEEPQRPSN